MRIAYTKERCLRRAPNEGTGHVGAGALAFTPKPQIEAESCSTNINGVRIAFGRFVQLMRREQGLSPEDFANKADIDVGELINIERTTCSPEPRTIHQLSNSLNIETKKLLQLSGLAELKEPELEHEALLFAASSESIDKLSKEEAEALEHFVTVLSEKR